MKNFVRMGNQIGDFYAAMPESEAADGAAKHLETGQAGLNPTAAHAVEALSSAQA